MSKFSEYTLYSGGHKGTEVAFGVLAEEYGINEVTLNFAGHQIERDVNVKILSDEELTLGAVSMSIISKHMERTFGHTDNIKKIFQTIFHIINNGFQVFAVGWIHTNNTIKGGTGWGVELAKFFNRPVSVFDQDRNEWYTWKDGKWVEDLPVIGHKTFSVTGTRNLTEQGEKAIEDLFARSFK